MPRRPPRPCRNPACRAVCQGGYCGACAKKYRATDRRPSAAKRGYGRTWRRLRLMKLRRDPICQAEGCTEPASEVDHPRAVRRPEEVLQVTLLELRSLCKACHSKKTAREDGSFGRKAR